MMAMRESSARSEGERVAAIAAAAVDELFHANGLEECEE